MAAISTIAAVATAAAAVGGAVDASQRARSAKKDANKQAEASLLADRNAKIEAASAETQAAQLASSKLANKNRARAASSLMAPGAGDTVGVTAGKTLLGQ